MRHADLNELATMNRIPRAVILREAVDDLLEKHRVIWSRSRDHGAPLREISGGPSKRKLRGQLAAARAHIYHGAGEKPAAALRADTAASFRTTGGSL
jgi:hypothetical protein